MMAMGHNLMRLMGIPTREDIEQARKSRDANQAEARRASREFAEVFSELVTVIRLRGHGNGDRQRDRH